MSNQEPLKWSLEFDLAKGGAGIKQAETMLSQLQNQMERMSGHFSSFGKNFSAALSKGGGGKNFLGGLSQMSSALSAMNSGSMSSVASLGRIGGAAGIAAVAIGTVATGIKKVYEGIDEITERAVKAFSIRTREMRTYSTILGGKERADERFQTLSALALKTEYTREQLAIPAMRTIVGGFHSKDDANRALLTVSDLASVAPASLQGKRLENLGNAISKINESPTLQQEGLRGIRPSLGSNLIYAEIAKTMGVKSRDVPELIHAHKVSSEIGINAIQQATLKELGTTKLGQFSMGAASNITTMLSNRDEAVQNMMLNIDPETLTNYKKYKDAIQEVTDTMAAGTKSGEDLKKTTEYLSNVGLGLKTAGNKFVAGFLTSFGDSFQKGLKALGGTADESANSTDKLGAAMKWLGEMLGKVGYAAAFIAKGIDSIGNAIDWYKTQWRLLIASMKDGWHAIAGFFGGIVDGLKSLFHGLYQMIDGVVHFSYSKIKEGIATLKDVNFASTDTTPSGSEVDKVKTQINQEKEDRILKKKKEDDQEKADKELQANIDKKRQAELDKLLKGDGGGGGKDKGTPISFDYGGKLLDLSSAMKMGVPPGLLGTGAAVMRPGSILPSSFPMATSSASIQVSKVEIIVNGGNSSPMEIADAVYTRFSQNIGRLVRAPSLQVI